MYFKYKILYYIVIWFNLIVGRLNIAAGTQVDLVNSVLSKLNTTVQSFFVRQQHRPHDISAFLDFLHEHPDIKRHILLLCDIDCLSQIMTQVKYNAIDKHASLLTY